MTSTDTQHRTTPTTAAWVWRDASLDDVVPDALPLALRSPTSPFGGVRRTVY